MKFVTMKSAPVARADFERNLWLLREKMKRRQLRFAPHIDVSGLLRVRVLPNGRIDLLSIDETTRLQANMMADMDDGWGASGGTKPGEDGNEYAEDAVGPETEETED